MRLFIAADITQRSRLLLNKKVKQFQKIIKQDLKWIEAQKWHITLKFLGETNKSKLTLLDNLLIKSIKNTDEFTLNINDISAFPDLKYPRVLFVSIDRGVSKLKKIHNQVDKQLSSAGFEPDDRNYVPHLTLARTYKQTDRKELAEKIKRIKQDYNLNIYSPISQIHLYQSKLMPDGPLYKKINSYSL